MARRDSLEVSQSLLGKYAASRLEPLDFDGIELEFILYNNLLFMDEESHFEKVKDNRFY